MSRPEYCIGGYARRPNKHFRDRVAARISPDLDAAWLYRRIRWAVMHLDDDPFLRFKCKLASRYPGRRRLYRFEWDGEEYFVAVHFRDDGEPVPVTIMTPDMDVARENQRRKRKLRGNGFGFVQKRNRPKHSRGR